MNKIEALLNQILGILIALILGSVSFLVMFILVILGNPLLPIPFLAQIGFAYHHIPELIGFFFVGWCLGEVTIALHKLNTNQESRYVDLVFLILLLSMSLGSLLDHYAEVVIPIVAIPSFLGYIVKRLRS